MAVTTCVAGSATAASLPSMSDCLNATQALIADAMNICSRVEKIEAALNGVEPRCSEEGADKEKVPETGSIPCLARNLKRIADIAAQTQSRLSLIESAVLSRE